MNIAMIVHSQTGNTHSVAEVLSEKLIKKGHTVTIERLVPTNEQELDPNKVVLNAKPDLTPYDGVILCCPVRGGNISGAMHAYLLNNESLNRKNVALFVTHFFPFVWMGGSTSINKMKNLCLEKHCNILGTGIVNWKSSKRESTIETLTNTLSGLFQ